MFDHSADLTQKLHARWPELGAPVANDSARVELLWEQLLEHYCEPLRAYYDLIHIGALLQLADRKWQHLRHSCVVEFAIRFHDLVYDSRAGDNEQPILAMAAPPDLPLFLDCDLSILGAPDVRCRKGRAGVLRRFADRPTLYSAPQMAARLEVVARRNIETELQELASTSTGGT